MTICELRIQLDLQPENKINVLEYAASKYSKGYLFVDLTDGHCYLFDRNGNEDDVKKIKYIGYAAFYKCKSLKSIVIPNSVEKIGDRAFSFCESLESIIIPDSVESIGDWTFIYCESLKSIEIPNSVKSIGDWAFEYCKNLKSLIFKGKTMKQVEAMENYPFGIEDESIIRCC